ncbi:14 kDa subunit of cytochrome bd ubiquinol oxidase [Polyplosphaeria fusca]|uniref:Complex III subunit 7 n=1 Tax=Polyplosphaeria fusca TaxID=682080 RepID=A0A9P4R9Q9_9PLEO|nr:14 kDa subunit of cytochrome bd ubiquinol oxidase [Polyplosphaeria fusca]
MSAPSFAPFIRSRPWLLKWMEPIAEWYCQKAGYRQLGLRCDDLIPEENDIVQLALKRLPPKEAYDRVFRLRRAFQCSVTHHLLPKEEWTKPDEDRPYLTNIIEEIEAEYKEREDLEAMIITKRKENAKH